MYLYFDKLGKLIGQRESLPVRVGNDNVNIIYAFFENTEFNGLATIKFRFSDGSTTNELAMSPCEEGEFILSTDKFSEGKNAVINPFEFGIDYSTKGYTQKFIMQDVNLVAGITNATIRLYKATTISQDTQIFAQGLIVFAIDDNLYDLYIEGSDEYNNLLQLMANKVDWGTTYGTLGISKNSLSEETPTVLSILDKRYNIESLENYLNLNNKPQINGVELTGDKSSEQLSILGTNLSQYSSVLNTDNLDSAASILILDNTGTPKAVSVSKLTNNVQTKNAFEESDEIETYIYKEV